MLMAHLQQHTKKDVMKQPYEKTQNLFVFYRTVSKPIIFYSVPIFQAISSDIDLIVGVDCK